MPTQLESGTLRLINATPHPVTLTRADESIVTLDVGNYFHMETFVTTTGLMDGVRVNELMHRRPVMITPTHEVLPLPSVVESIYYLVPTLIAQYHPRSDFLTAYPIQYDWRGNPRTWELLAHDWNFPHDQLAFPV